MCNLEKRKNQFLRNKEQNSGCKGAGEKEKWGDAGQNVKTFRYKSGDLMYSIVTIVNDNVIQ